MRKSEKPVSLWNSASLRADTILPPTSKQNRPLARRATFATLPKRAVGRCTGLRFLVVLSVLFALGCGGSELDIEKPAVVADSERPPLKIWLVDVPELEQELSVRWQAASDQPIKIQNLSMKELSTSTSVNPDVLIYAGSLMGDLVLKETIAKLPLEATSKKNARPKREVQDPSVSEKQNEDPADAWPVRWRNAATLGGQRYAVPLGSTGLSIIHFGLDPSPLAAIDAALGDSKDLDNTSTIEWDRFLKSAEAVLAVSLPERQKALSAKLAKCSDTEMGYLVDQFLWVASTTTARRKGLFDLVSMDSRLGQPEFVMSARVLARLAILFPNMIATEPTKGWSSVLAESQSPAGFAIGRPSPMAGEDELGADNAKRVSVGPILWHPGNGLLASLGKKTRQTNASCQLLFWLAEPDQRASFRTICPAMELEESQQDRSRIGEDYRKFQQLNMRDIRVEGMELSLRLANADQYRAILAEHLISVIRDSQQTDRAMAECANRWNELTKKLGKETQRKSEEHSLGFRN